jgi:ribonuclease BN (tRNA processing enzyme)
VASFPRRDALVALALSGLEVGMGGCVPVSAPAGSTKPVPPDAVALAGEVQGYRTKLILLGTAGGPTPAAGRRGVASALVVGDRAYLVDAGYGTVRTLFQAGLTIADLEQVFITHTHSDHIADLFSLIWLNRPTVNLARPLPVHGPGSAGRLPTTIKPLPLVDPDRPPPGMSEVLAGLVRAYAYEINIRTVENSDPRDIRADLTAHDLLPPPSARATPDNTAPAMAPFPVFEDTRVKVSAILVPHGPVFPSFAYRFDTEDGTVVFSGDTRYSPNVARIADSADILVHEAVDLDAFAQAGPHNAMLRDHLIHAHTTAQDVGRVATSAQAKQVVLTHLVPADPRIVDDLRWERSVRSTYGGPVVIGHDLIQLGVGRKT